MGTAVVAADTRRQLMVLKAGQRAVVLWEVHSLVVKVKVEIRYEENSEDLSITDNLQRLTGKIRCGQSQSSRSLMRKYSALTCRPSTDGMQTPTKSR